MTKSGQTWKAPQVDEPRPELREDGLIRAIDANLINQWSNYEHHKKIHPSKLRLIETTAELLQEVPFVDLRIEDVIQASGLTKGSLYHHFDDFAHLVELTQCTLFVRHTQEDLDRFIGLFTFHSDPQEVRALLHSYLMTREQESRGYLRRVVFESLMNAVAHHRMKLIFTRIQEQILGKLGKLYLECRLKGWAHPHLDPNCVAMMLQHALLGRVLDDASFSHVEVDKCAQSVFFQIDNTLFQNFLASDRSLVPGVL